MSESTDVLPAIVVRGGVAFTDSLEVARVFGKRHDNVIRSIDHLTARIPGGRGLLNFEERSWHDPASADPTYPKRHFYLTRDGLALLVMGFTGDAALVWKLKYIDAFNAMETQLRRSDIAAPAPITADQVQEMIGAALSAALPAVFQKASEFKDAEVFTNGITVSELIGNMHLPIGINRRSVAQSLRARLTMMCAKQTLPVFQRDGVLYFPKKHAGDAVQEWRLELIERAKRDKRQAELKLVVPSTGA
jgi:Rha family phage regulatory protein